MRLSRHRSVLQFISDHGFTDRRTIASHFNFTLSGSKRLVDDLTRKKCVFLTGKKNISKGRPSEYLDFNPYFGYLGALEVGRANNKAALFDFQGNLIQQHVEVADFSQEPAEVIKALAARVESWRSQFKGKITAWALSASGVVDPVNAEVHHLHREKAWESFNPAAILSDRVSSLEIVSFADAAMAAETNRGVLNRQTGTAIFLHLGSTVSAALMVEGEKYAGQGTPTGYIGHAVVPGSTLVCYCGRTGCAEAGISTEGIIGRYTKAGNEVTGLEDMIKKAVSGDNEALRVIEQSVETAARLLTPCVSLLVPNTVVVGGLLFFENRQLAEKLIKIMDSTIRQEVFYRIVENLKIVPSALGNDSIITGTAILARNRWINNNF